MVNGKPLIWQTYGSVMGILMSSHFSSSDVWWLKSTTPTGQLLSSQRPLLKRWTPRGAAPWAWWPCHGMAKPRQFVSKRKKITSWRQRVGNIWRFPKIGASPNHPFIDGFSLPWFWGSPMTMETPSWWQSPSNAVSIVSMANPGFFWNVAEAQPAACHPVTPTRPLRRVVLTGHSNRWGKTYGKKKHRSWGDS